MTRHAAANAVPALDGTELAGVLEDLAGIHAGIDLIRDGLRLLAVDRLNVDLTQTVLAALCGSPDGTDVEGAIGLLEARLTNPTTNPCLRSLPDDQQKEAQRHGENTAHLLTDPYHPARETTAEAIAHLG